MSTEPRGVIMGITQVCSTSLYHRSPNKSVSLDGSEPEVRSGMIADPGTYQSILYQATKLNGHSTHHIQLTNLPGELFSLFFGHSS